MAKNHTKKEIEQKLLYPLKFILPQTCLFPNRRWDKPNLPEHLPKLCRELCRCPGLRFPGHKHIRRDIHIFSYSFSSLAEISFQHTLKAFSVSCFVFCHLTSTIILRTHKRSLNSYIF